MRNAHSNAEASIFLRSKVLGFFNINFRCVSYCFGVHNRTYGGRLAPFRFPLTVTSLPVKYEGQTSHFADKELIMMCMSFLTLGKLHTV